MSFMNEKTTRLHRPSTAVDDPVYRMRDTTRATGLARSTIYGLIERGVFPSPMKLGTRSIGWRQSVIEKWLASREAA